MNKTYCGIRPTPFRLLGVLLGASLLLVNVGCCPTCGVGDDVKYPYSTAMFDHDAHTTNVTSCTTCHHDGAGQVACSVCHQAEWIAGVPKLKEAQHQTCRNCHDAMAGQRVRCDYCHAELKDL